MPCMGPSYASDDQIDTLTNEILYLLDHRPSFAVPCNSLSEKNSRWMFDEELKLELRALVRKIADSDSNNSF